MSQQTRLRSPGFAHDWIEHDGTAPAQVGQRITDAAIVIVNKVKITAAMLEGADHLKLIAVAATGTDNLDLAACRDRDIVVSNVRHYAGHTLPEHTFALIFALRRSLLAYRDSVRAGRWQESAQFCFFDHPIRDLAGSTLGVIGHGSLGSRVADIGRALGMQVLVAGRKGQAALAGRVSFDDVLAQSDVLTLHLPLRPETRHLIGEREFAQMQKRPLLINVARGGLVDESALVKALDAGQISGAGFDVASVEPPPADHPLMGLADRANVIVTPHVAWASVEARQALADQLIENIEAAWRGEPRNVVTG